MNKNDFRYFRQGKQVNDLKEEDFSLIKSVYNHSNKNERALLLLHGFSSTPAVYRLLIPQLKNYDAVMCPVLPGHGKSIDAFSKATAADWVAEATCACEELFKTYKKIDVMGFSLGGLLACKLSERFAFNHMFLLAPALKLKINVTSNLKLANFLQSLGFKELRGAAGNLRSNAQAEISYKRLPLTAIEEMFNLVLQHQWTPPNAPVDLFLGAHDAVVPSDAVERLFQDLPNVSMHWLANSAHVLPLDNDLGQIVACVNEK
ncbi:MAG: Thermostable monoacylglycerol lipase [Legionella sp.]|uniref:alpha/beta hydrolase n=1 Tax=Legionella sp. TaxID=459 RepID=UPI003D140E80